MLESQLATANTGIKLSYRTWEGDGPPMVLVHGLASTMRIWDFTAPVLAERYRVVAYDQRGHATSDKPEGGYDLPTMLADLRDLVSGLDLHKPIVAGHSWGATLALAYAAHYPDDCAGIALIDGGLGDMKDWPGADWDIVSRNLAPPDLSRYTLDDLMNFGRRHELENLPEGFLDEYFGSMMDVMPDRTIRARLTRPRHMQILRAIWDASPRAMLGQVRCPVLAVLARPAGATEADPFLQSKQRGVKSLELAQGRTDVVWMPDTIHDIPLQRPERLAQEILDFFGTPV